MSDLFMDPDLDRLVLDVKRSMVTARLDGLSNQLYSLLLENEGIKVSVDATEDQRTQAVAANEKRIESIRAGLELYKAELDAIDAFAKKTNDTATLSAAGTAG